MATTSRKSSGPVLRSLSPSGRFCSQNTSNSSFSSSFASSTSTSFSSPSSAFFHHQIQQHHHNDHGHHQHHHHHQRAASPTRVNLYTSAPPASSVRFSIDHRSISPNRNHHVIRSHNGPIPSRKKTCMCSPTSHPGSFRCSLHKNASHGSGGHHNAAPYPSNRLNMLRSAMTNSLVRIGGVEGDWVKRALTALIRPSSHQLKRRSAYKPTPSRLSVVSMAEDL